MLHDEWRSQSRWERIKLAWNLRKLHLAYNGIWFLLGLLSVISAISYFVDPNHLLQQQHLTHHLVLWGYGWSFLYGLGGIGMMAGDLRMNAPTKVLGLSIFSGALLVQALGIIVYSFQPGVFTLLALVLASLARIYALMTMKAFPETLAFPHRELDDPHHHDPRF